MRFDEEVNELINQQEYMEIVGEMYEEWIRIQEEEYANAGK
jgi:hypothetical protein